MFFFFLTFFSFVAFLRNKLAHMSFLPHTVKIIIIIMLAL